MDHSDIIANPLPWQGINLDEIEMDDLVQLQRRLRLAIESRRKLTGKLRQKSGGGGAPRALPEPLHPGKDGYRALVKSVAPARLRDSADRIDRCVLGVSLGGGNAAEFHGAKLEAIVRWIAARANHCCVLVGDSLGRISLEVREGMEPQVAEREARALGQRYAEETEAMFRRYTTDEVTFEFRFGTEYFDHPSFAAYLDNVQAHYDNDPAFRELVHAFAGEYLYRTARSLGHGEAGPSERWQRIARAYLIEEVALLGCLAADGWPVLVYPGSIDSIVEIAEGRFPSLPAPLQGLGFVSLWLDAKRGAR